MRERKMYKTCAVLAGACLVLAVAGTAQSRIVIQPKVELGLKNNSNFWKSDTNEVSVNTYYAKPGVFVAYETPKTQISFDGTIDFNWYDDQESRPTGVSDASDDDYTGFAGSVSILHQLTDRLNIGVADSLFVTRDAAEADALSNSVARDKYTYNAFEPRAYYQIADKFGIEARYRNGYTDYEKGLEDSTENRGIFDFYYYMNRSSRVFLDYQVWARNYDQATSDYTSNKITANYQYSMNYFSLGVGGGYHTRTFDDNVSDLDLFSWGLTLTGMDPETTKKTTKTWLLVGLGQDMNDDGTGNSYYTSTYLSVEGGYRFFNKLAVSLKGNYSNADYDTETRTDDTYGFSGRVEYRAIDYFTIGLEGGVETRDSDVTGNDYDDTFVMLTLNVDYDLGSR